MGLRWAHLGGGQKDTKGKNTEEGEEDGESHSSVPPEKGKPELRERGKAPGSKGKGGFR